jgi:glycosyltransferase involved in cell wall biosynthesis
MKILIDFQDIINKYWGIPLATIDDIKSIGTLSASDIFLWLSKKEKKIIYEAKSSQIKDLNQLKKSITMLETRPENLSLWYLQFLKTFNDIETDFHYTCHFPATKIQSTQRIIRIHDPYSNSAQSWREFFKKDKLKNKVARAIRNESFKLVESKSKIVCNSKFTAKRVAQIYDIPMNYIDVIPYGFNWQTFESIEGKRDRQPLYTDYYLMISGLRGNKRPDLVINAWANCIKTLPKLVVVGKIPLKSLSQLAVKQISNGRLILKEFVNESDLENLKINSNAMIFASSYEGFGRPVTEALLSGVPSIANDLEVFKEISLDCVDFFSLSNPMSIEPLLLKYSEKIDNKKSQFLVKKAEFYSYESIGRQWSTILNVKKD